MHKKPRIDQTGKNNPNFRHGLIYTSEYSSWGKMISRCTNKKNNRYKSYGGRGITVCKRWLDFRNFIKDMGMKPDNSYSIDRVNNEKNYTKSNCKWSTRKEQMRNRQNANKVMFKGKLTSIKELAERFNFKYETLRYRLLILKWPIKDAVSIPVKNGNNQTLRPYGIKRIEVK